MSLPGLLAGHANPALPPGFVYEADFLAVAEEQRLLAELGRVSWAAVIMRGQVARRRTAHFGWRYEYDTWKITPGPPPPAFLAALCPRAAELLGIRADDLAEILLTEYAPGAGIGWHRDAPMFGAVIGVSLGAACRLRLVRQRGGTTERRDITLAPRSAYVLDGEARWQWRHSIAPLKALRYSITFRTLRGQVAPRGGRVRRAAPEVA